MTVKSPNIAIKNQMEAAPKRHHAWIVFPLALAAITLMTAGSISHTVVADVGYSFAQPGL